MLFCYFQHFSLQIPAAGPGPAVLFQAFGPQPVIIQSAGWMGRITPNRQQPACNSRCLAEKTKKLNHGAAGFSDGNTLGPARPEPNQARDPPTAPPECWAYLSTRVHRSTQVNV